MMILLVRLGVVGANILLLSIGISHSKLCLNNYRYTSYPPSHNSFAPGGTSTDLKNSGGYHGLGKHVWIVPIEDVVTVMQILFAYVLIYVVTVPLIKFSILLLYRRIFGMTWTIWVCMLLTAGYFVSCAVAFLVCCQPVSYYWSQYADPTGGKCVFDLYPFYIGNAAANLTTDVLILLVPIPLTWKLQMRTSQKILIIGIFLLGGLYEPHPSVFSFVQCLVLTWIKFLVSVLPVL